MGVHGVETLMNSASTGLRRFGRAWPDGPDVGGQHRFTNTATPRFDGTGCWQQHLLVFRAEIERVVDGYGGPTVVRTSRWGGVAGRSINAGQGQGTLERPSG